MAGWMENLLVIILSIIIDNFPIGFIPLNHPPMVTDLLNNKHPSVVLTGTWSCIGHNMNTEKKNEDATL